MTDMTLTPEQLAWNAGRDAAADRIHLLYGENPTKADVVKYIRALKTPQFQPVPPSDVVEALVKALKPFAKEGGEPLWNEDDTDIQTRPSIKLDWRGGSAHFTVGDLRRAKAALKAMKGCASA